MEDWKPNLQPTQALWALVTTMKDIENGLSKENEEKIVQETVHENSQEGSPEKH